MKQRTFSIIKPDAVKRNLIGKILSIFETHQFQIIAMKMVLLQKFEAEGFYIEHKGQQFFENLINIMTSGACVVLVLEGDNAVEKMRKLIGVTDPSKADEGTIRHKFALNMQQNSVHASDSLASATKEIDYFFSTNDIVRKV